jgi:hypothetical protein
MVETAVLALASSAATASAGTAIAAGAAGTAATVAGSAAATSALAGSTAVLASAGGTLLSGALTAASVFGQFKSGQMASVQAKAQSDQYELSARQEELKGRDQADRIRRSLQATLASQNAAFASRGINLGSGTPVALGNVSKSEASRDIELAQFGTGMNAAAERGNAAQARMSGKAAKIESYTNMATSLYKGGSLIT